MYYLQGEREQRTFETFNPEGIKKGIIEMLTTNPDDLIEYCKDWDTTYMDKKYFPKVIDIFEVHKWKICKVITKGNKDFYKPLN